MGSSRNEKMEEERKRNKYDVIKKKITDVIRKFDSTV